MTHNMQKKPHQPHWGVRAPIATMLENATLHSWSWGGRSITRLYVSHTVSCLSLCVRPHLLLMAESPAALGSSDVTFICHFYVPLTRVTSQFGTTVTRIHGSMLSADHAEGPLCWQPGPLPNPRPALRVQGRLSVFFPSSL